ncbi:MAG: bacteriocin [Lachnospiraceae bacterium]|nr:bacteriocin [Lachnospiraceae bacterium]
MEREMKDLLKNAKMSDKTVKGMQKLSDDELKEVSGGFIEDEGYAAGHEVHCPNCQADTKSSFITYIASDELKLDGYECQNPACRFVFGVDYLGRYWW